MLPLKYRLKKKKDIDRVFKEGKGIKEDFLFLKFTSNNLGNSRFAVIVSRKISKRATIRNKIKRKIRAVISQKLPKIKKGKDCVLIALPGLVSRDFFEIEEATKKLFEKTKLTHDADKTNSRDN
jgi:ribonuclease P protein component